MKSILETPRAGGRRGFLRALGAVSLTGGTALLGSGWTAFAGAHLECTGETAAPGTLDPILEGRPMVRYPEKKELILLTSRPPQLETPVQYFDRAFTPNDLFYVRYHLASIPTRVDLATWRLKVSGRVERPLQLSLEDLKTKFPPVRVVAVNQCSGNSRGRFSPRVFGGQWGEGAMGNAEWLGARMQDILRAAGVQRDAVEVTFNGLDEPTAPSVPDFVKSLAVSRLLDDPDVLVAYETNGDPLPMLNGFPARLIVPGWYATYWVKHMSAITVLDREFEGFWMKKAYRIPDTPCACVEPGGTPERTVPVSRMNVRSVIASPRNGERLQAGRPVEIKGVAFDGGHGIREVAISDDGGVRWRAARLGPDLGRFSFRQWSYVWKTARPGSYRLLARAVNGAGESQPAEPRWNPAGYMRNVIEHVDVRLT